MHVTRQDAVLAPPSAPLLSRLGWIGHAGMACSRPGRAPTRATLTTAIQLDLDWIELDVCATGDGTLVLRHDVRLGNGPRLSDIPHAELRRREPEILTLDEAVEHVAGTAPLMLDIKARAAVAPLARWLSARGPDDGLAVCCGSVSALAALRDRVRRVPRWRSLPPPGTRGPEHAHLSIARLIWLRWRRQVADWLRDLATEVDAAGLCVHHRLVTTALCRRAHWLRLPVTAWTVNRASAVRRVARCGVDLVTTDDVADMRRAAGAEIAFGGPQGRPRLGAQPLSGC